MRLNADTFLGLTVPRIISATAWFSLIMAMLAWAYLGGWWALSYALGAMWMMANFALLAAVIVLLTSSPRRSKAFLFIVICAKIAVVSVVLYWVFQIPNLRHLGLAMGITTLLVVIFLKAVGAAAFPTRQPPPDTQDETSR
jgi:hypothetical protein